MKFSNGDPLTPADVVFTFEMLKKNPTLDVNAVWSVLSSVAQKGSNQVVMTFKTEAVPYFYYVADQVGIVDRPYGRRSRTRCIYPDKNPVGTGAFTTGAKDCTPAEHQVRGQPALLAAR